MSKELKIKIENNLDNEYSEYKYNYFLPKISTKKMPYREHVLKNLDRQLPSRPKEVVFCKKCVVSNQRPRITFDENGVCSACNYAEYKKTSVDWSKRKKEFETLLDKYRRNNGRWDVVVPCSGGKDSGSLAHRLKYKYGMHPLCITWSPLLYTNIGMQNFQNMILSGLDSYLCSSNRILQRKLSKLFFVLQGDHFMSFGRGQMAYPLRIALKEDIKLIMWGENAELEYGGDTKNRDVPYNPLGDWDRYYYKDITLKKLLNFGYEHGYLDERDIKDPSLQLYMVPSLEKIEKADITMHWYGWYFNWVPQENYYYAAENYAFQALPRRSEATYSKYASLDDITDPFHYYMSLIKFGIGRATSDAGHEIRDGHIAREEGVQLVRRYDQEFPGKYFRDFLEYLSITEEEFWEVVNAYRSISPHLWKKINGKWELKHIVS